MSIENHLFYFLLTLQLFACDGVFQQPQVGEIESGAARSFIDGEWVNYRGHAQFSRDQQYAYYLSGEESGEQAIQKLYRKSIQDESAAQLLEIPEGSGWLGGFALEPEGVWLVAQVYDGQNLKLYIRSGDPASDVVNEISEFQQSPHFYPAISPVQNLVAQSVFDPTSEALVLQILKVDPEALNIDGEAIQLEVDGTILTPPTWRSDRDHLVLLVQKENSFFVEVIDLSDQANLSNPTRTSHALGMVPDASVEPTISNERLYLGELIPWQQADKVGTVGNQDQLPELNRLHRLHYINLDSGVTEEIEFPGFVLDSLGVDAQDRFLAATIRQQVRCQGVNHPTYARLLWTKDLVGDRQRWLHRMFAAEDADGSFVEELCQSPAETSAAYYDLQWSGIYVTDDSSFDQWSILAASHSIPAAGKEDLMRPQRFYWLHQASEQSPQWRLLIP